MTPKTNAPQAQQTAEDVAQRLEAYAGMEDIFAYLAAVEANVEVSLTARLRGGHIVVSTGGSRVEFDPYEAEVRVWDGSAHARVSLPEDIPAIDAGREWLAEAVDGKEIRA